MATYRTLASKPEDRELLLKVLMDGSELHRKITRAHASAELRRKLGVDHSGLIAILLAMETDDPQVDASISYAVASMRNHSLNVDRSRRANGVATLNLTTIDRLEARDALKRYAKLHPSVAAQCKALYARIKL